MVKGVTLTKRDFPEALAALNKLADKLATSPSTRPSIRKLAAETVLEGCRQREKQLEAIRDDLVPPQNKDKINKSETLSQEGN